MPKGSEELLNYVNGFLEDERKSGRIGRGKNEEHIELR